NGTACMNGQCQVACSMNAPCNTGCCSNAQGGTCLAGTANKACGSSSTCVDCSLAQTGHVCIPNKDSCGCTVSADCPPGAACNLATGLCSNMCNANQVCNGGCCTGGTCAAGTVKNACGSQGAACVDCSASQAGTLCIAGACGCNAATDCPAGFACDGNTHACTKSCGVNQP